MVGITFLIWRKQALQSQRDVLHGLVFSQATGCLFNKCIYLKPVHKNESSLPPKLFPCDKTKKKDRPRTYSEHH